MAAGGWVSKSCKNFFGERVGRARNNAHGNRRPYQTRPPINAWSRLHYDQWCLGNLQQMRMHLLLTPMTFPRESLLTRNIAGLIGCCINCFHVLDGCNCTTRACHNVCSCWGPNSYTSVKHCYNVYALRAVAVGFVEVQPGFLQLLLTQTWTKCTSLDSSRCVVYSDIRFKVIRAASKNLEQDEWWKVWLDSVYLLFIEFLKIFLLTIGLWF